ncbi:UDP-glucose 4-epimerase GalE [Acinetobacter sp.]|uniref:UDP-glucose 4-epimerase GalE n=1 Tax=Acinetobacter sp. TaxID=472 RepID=UPI000C3DBE7A|nr:UDP-glucose 4-epimerase GalE [Acinetobacter sp.]MBC69630.1 UDP-glucose 4-epimerase GalE [Acinetobacter sp.]
MKSILVTGGAGYIGSHISLSLLEKGFNVYSIDSFINSTNKSISILKKYSQVNRNEFSRNFKFYNGDIRNENLLIDIFNEAKKNNFPIIAVIHFAGLKSVLDSTNNPLKYWSNNLSGTINLLSVMEKFECNNLIFSSSATVYGHVDNAPISEDSNIDPINPYGKTKAYIESLLFDLNKSKNRFWKIRILRYFNPVGSHSSGLLGEDYKGENDNLFPILCDVAYGNKNILDIYGNDWPTKDGTCIRDYIHIMDLVSGHLCCLESIFSCEDKISVFNLGTGKGTSIIELINIFEKVNNVKINHRFVERRNGDSPVLIANCDLIFEKLNWKSERTIEDMCRDCWIWKIKNDD